MGKHSDRVGETRAIEAARAATARRMPDGTLEPHTEKHEREMAMLDEAQAALIGGAK